MRVLVIDHEDSFLWNLVQAIGARVGEWPRVLSHRSDWTEVQRELEARPGLVVLGPGPGHAADPRDAGVSARLLREIAPEVPIFGVCLGLQLVAHHFGARLRRAESVQHGKTSAILHGGVGLFEGLPEGSTMMRYHSWVVDEASLPAELEVLARSDRGELMALRHRRRPIQAVQFHPESVGSPEGPRLLDQVVRWARQRLQMRL